jgi:hypothetical protein
LLNWWWDYLVFVFLFIFTVRVFPETLLLDGFYIGFFRRFNFLLFLLLGLDNLGWFLYDFLRFFNRNLLFD